MRDDTYTFRIDSFTPATLPLARLAEYLAALADLFGEEQSVHFKALKKGSAQVVNTVEKHAAPKVRLRVQNASTVEASADIAEPFQRINKMLRLDNATGQLKLGTARILDFPGRKAIKPPIMGPFTQPFERDGVLVRIGGKDKSAHAIIRDPEGEDWSFEISRDLARSLCHHLFGGPLRLRGTARWLRNEDGKWEYTSLRASDFVELSSASLKETLDQAGHLYRQHALGEDPIGLLRDLRNDDDEDKGPT